MISRQEAKAQGLPRYYTGKPCLRGHLSERLTANSNCWVCQTERNQKPEAKAKKAIRDRTPEAKAKRRVLIAIWAAANPEKIAAFSAAHYAANQEKVKARSAVHYAANKERKAATQAAWKKANPAALAALAAQYRAAKLKATPAWADRQAIKKIYDDCAFVSRVTGEKHHVDHRYPLQSDWVCGLHVIENLQILTATENCSKGNRHDPSAITCD